MAPGGIKFNIVSIWVQTYPARIRRSAGNFEMQYCREASMPPGSDKL